MARLTVGTADIALRRQVETLPIARSPAARDFPTPWTLYLSTLCYINGNHSQEPVPRRSGFRAIGVTFRQLLLIANAVEKTPL
jgi:hypothetical protein